MNVSPLTFSITFVISISCIIVFFFYLKNASNFRKGLILCENENESKYKSLFKCQYMSRWSKSSMVVSISERCNSQLPWRNQILGKGGSVPGDDEQNIYAINVLGDI